MNETTRFRVGLAKRLIQVRLEDRTVMIVRGRSRTDRLRTDRVRWDWFEGPRRTGPADRSCIPSWLVSVEAGLHRAVTEIQITGPDIAATRSHGKQFWLSGQT